MEKQLIQVAVMGASGYAGLALVKQLLKHPRVEIRLLTAHQGAGQHLSSLQPDLERLGPVGMLNLHESVLEDLEVLDVIFLALPHGISQTWVKRIRQHATYPQAIEPPVLIDLSGDYRLEAPQYEAWYGEAHQDLEGLASMHYGLPSLFETPQQVRAISNPGCYPTATLLALAPLVANDYIACDDIVVDAKSGISGAGRSVVVGNLYCEVSDSVKPYGIIKHRHTPEIERYLSKLSKKPCLVQFTPHLMPMQKGLLATCYCRPTDQSRGLDTPSLLHLYRDYYAKHPLVKIIEGLPETRWAVDTPYAYIHVAKDPRTQRILTFCAIDNTLFGAATQGIQNMNIAMGFNDLEGLNA